MDPLNLTHFSLGGYVDVEKYRYVYFLIIFPLYILIICCNATIVLLIVIHQNLHEPMYIYIAALLINSALFSTVIFPKLLIDILSDDQIISISMCHLQFFMYYFVGGSEFYLLSAMAYDRYVSICKPLQYRTIMRRGTVIALLVSAWIFPACQMAASTIYSSRRHFCVFTLKGLFCNNLLYKLYCETSTVLTIYGLVIMLISVILPILYIAFTYTKILGEAYRSGPEVRRKALHTCTPHLLVLINYSIFCSYDIIRGRLESHMPKSASLVLNLQVVLYHPLFNPLMYGLKMKEINKHLKNLFSRLKYS